MALAADIRKTAADTGYAVVGATDIAVEHLRAAQARAAAARGEIEIKRVQESLQQVPTAAMTKSLEAAGRVEETYSELSARGKKLVDRIRQQRATQDLLAQGKVAVSRTRAAVTTVRRGAEGTVASAKGTAATAQGEASAGADEVSATARKRTQSTASAAKRTNATARKRATAAKSASKGAATSTTKAASAAGRATRGAADKVGD